MRYMRCKCGRMTAWTSMGSPECSGCPDCNTTLDEFPTDHREPAPHEWETEWTIDRKTGERTEGQRCRVCYKESDTVIKGNMEIPQVLSRYKLTTQEEIK